MAITAAITMGSATSKALQKTAASLVITNTGASAVSVTNVVPYVTVSGLTPRQTDVNLGLPPIGPGMPVSVPGSSGTLTMSFDVVPLEPHIPTYGTNPFPSSGPGMPSGVTPLPPIAEPQSIVYAVGATVYTSDGSVTTATTGSLTVTPVNY